MSVDENWNIICREGGRWERIDSTDSDKSQSGGKHHVNIYLQYIQQTYYVAKYICIHSCFPMPAESSEERIQAMKQCNGNGKRLIVFSINIKEKDTRKVHNIM